MPFNENIALVYQSKEKVGTLRKSSIVPEMAKSILEKAPNEWKSKLI